MPDTMVWERVTPGSKILTRDGATWTLEGRDADGTVTITSGDQRVATKPTAPAQVIWLAPAPTPDPLSADQRRMADRAVEALKRAEEEMEWLREQWLTDLPIDERTKRLMEDLVLEAESFDPDEPMKRNWLIAPFGHLDRIEAGAHLSVFHGETEPPEVLCDPDRAVDIHTRSHGTSHRGKLGWITHTHDAPTTSGYDLLTGLADNDALYVHGGVTAEEVTARAVRLFPDDLRVTPIVTAAIASQDYGIDAEWQGCPQCRQIQQRSVSSKAACSMTPGCEGRPERIARKPRRPPRRKAKQ